MTSHIHFLKPYYVYLLHFLNILSYIFLLPTQGLTDASPLVTSCYRHSNADLTIRDDPLKSIFEIFPPNILFRVISTLNCK